MNKGKLLSTLSVLKFFLEEDGSCRQVQKAALDFLRNAFIVCQQSVKIVQVYVRLFDIDASIETSILYFKTTKSLNVSQCRSQAWNL